MRLGAAALAAGAILSCAATAQAQRPATLGTGAPTGQMGVQLYDWSQYLQDGRGEITCPAAPEPATPNCVNPPAPSTSAARLERVFAYLQAKGIKNVELYGYPGNPFPTNNGPIDTAGLQALRDLGDHYGLRFVSRHGNLNESYWDQDVAASKIVGQEVIGSAGLPGSPGTGTYANTLATAQLMNRLGKRSVEAGLGPAYFHNHQGEFTTKYVDNGVLKSVWQIIMDRTDPRYVKAQIDIFWAVSGGADVVSLVNQYSNRIVSFHVKDGVNPSPSANTANLRALGDGVVDFTPIFAAGKNRVRYYHYEYDPVTPGNNGGFNPFNTTDKSLGALKGEAAPVVQASPTLFPSVPAGTAAAANVVPVTVRNSGDAPLTITAVGLSADANDGGNATRDDFLVVSQNCTGAPIAPGATCTANIGFKPTRTNYLSIASVRFTSNADDATETAQLTGKSTGEAIGTVGGDVPSMLALSLPAQAGSFGTFQPTIAKSYETAMAGTVTSTAGNATLSVTDTSSSFPGHLVNGGFSIPAPLNVRAINSTNPTQAFAPLAEATNAPTTLLTYSGPANADLVTIGFRQAIGAGDVLRSGTYSKSLTFTLSTTAP